MKSFILNASLLKGKSNSKLATERGSYLFNYPNILIYMIKNICNI